MLGLMYEEGKYHLGEGVLKNDKEAVKWFRKAADQGHAESQNNLGVRYYKGEGVEKDYVKAAEWFRKAAEQGDARAQFMLGLMYDLGDGVSKDEVESYAWLLLAKANGEEFASQVISIRRGSYGGAEGEGQARAAALRRLIEQKSAK